jgi:hypothetical protein
MDEIRNRMILSQQDKKLVDISKNKRASLSLSLRLKEISHQWLATVTSVLGNSKQNSDMINSQ